jgi:RNA polymerase sigma-70 factor, ECF subfamily
MTSPVAVDFADLDDTQLMQRVQADDSEAFGVLYDRFAARAHGLARGIGTHAHADDIVQEAFLSAWRSRAKFTPERDTVLAWLMGNVRNRAIDSLRRQGGHDNRRANAEGIEDRFHASGNLENEIAERDEAAQLRRSLASLPPAQRDVIAFAYFGELSATEIAAELSLPLGTVKGRMRLGLDKLRIPVE